MPDNTNLSRRRFLKATGGAATAAAVAGCIDTGSDSGSNGGTLNFINSSMTTLDPIEAEDTASGRVIQQIFDALMNYPNGEVSPEKSLAKDYETSSDFTKYTFHLKEGATYHNGDEVTANDVVYSFERLAQSDNSHRKYFILDSIGVKHEKHTEEQKNEDGEMEEVDVYTANSLAVKAEGDYTVTMELKEPFHSTLPMLAYTSFSVIPEGIVGDIEGYDGEIDRSEFAKSNPIGAGPFEFDKWKSGTEAKVTKFEDYHGETASLDAIHWQVIDDPTAMYTYSMEQKADVLEIPNEHYDPKKVTVEETDDLGRKVGTYGPIRNGMDVNYLAVATINAFYIGFNTNHVEKPARKAIAYAMNQQTMVDEVFKGRGQPAYHFTPPNIYPGGANAYEEHAKNNYPYGYNERDLEKARGIMEDAGYSQSNMYEFTFTMYKSGTAWHEMGSILRDQLQNAHIDMKLEKAPFSTLLERGANGNLEAYSLGWVMDWPAPDNFLQLLNPPQTDTSQPAPVSYTNWSDTDAAQRATDAWSTIDSNRAPTDEAQQARNDAYVAMEEANWEDVTFLNVYHRTDDRFYYDRVDLPKFGGAGPSRQMYNTTTLEE